MEFSPYLLLFPPCAGREHLPFVLGLGPSLRLGCEARDPAFAAELVTREVLVSLRCRPGVRSWIASALEGRPSRNRSVMPETLDHWSRNDGAMVMPSVPGKRVTGVPEQRQCYPRGWAADWVSAHYVRRIIGLAQAHGATVYWLIPPIHPAVQEANRAAGFDARYVRFVRAQQRRYPSLVVIDGRDARYDPDVFLDAAHLGREGAVALSEDLGDLLRSRPGTAAARWIGLPPYRPRPTDPAIVTARPDVFLR